MALLLAHKNRKFTRDLVMLDADGATVVPGDSDVARIKIGLRGETPVLDLDSATNSANGSSVSLNTPSSGTTRLQILAADMAITPGVYTLEFAIYDNTDSAIKHVDAQVFVVQNTMTGDVGAS